MNNQIIISEIECLLIDLHSEGIIAYAIDIQDRLYDRIGVEVSIESIKKVMKNSAYVLI